MAEKKCPQCAMTIPPKAKICPYCRKKLGWTIGAKLGLALIIIVIGVYALGLLNSPSTQKSPPSFTDEQKKAAKEYGELLMQSGLVKQYKGEGRLQIAYVDKKLWGITTYEQKKGILKNLSGNE